MYPQPTGAYGVMNTLRALERLAVSSQSTTELAEHLRIDPRSARKLLQRLAAEGYVVQDDSHRKRYTATLRLAAMGRQLLERAALPRVAQRWIAELAETTSSTAHLWIPAADRVMCLVHAGAPEEAGAPDEPDNVVVLDRPRLCQRSCVYGPGVAAAAVIDRGMVIAAVGVTGEVAQDDLAAVVRAARGLTVELAASS
jgi:DNA-binding MarR family transcriptional regulator